MRTTLFLFALAGIGCLAGQVYSQDEGDGRRSEPPRGRSGFSRVEPVMTALDANQDNELSAEEMANAAAALKELDRDKNGKLTQDELRPDFGGRGGFPGAGPRRGGPDGPGGFGRRGGPDGGPRGPGGFGGDRPGALDRGGPGRSGPGPAGFGALTPEQFVARALEFDADKDGELDKVELTALGERLGRGFGGRGGFGSRGDEARNPVNRRGGPRQRPGNERQ